jgi:hypothetical protein
MAEDDTADRMPGENRFVHGPRPLGAVLPHVTRPAFRRGNAASARIIADWEAMVGPKVAAVTVPRRLDRGVLTIACAGPTALQLHYVGVELIRRINTHLGGEPVHSLKFTQAGMPRSSAASPAPPPLAVKEAEAAVADLPEGDLKSALEALGRVVIGRSKYSTRRPRKL